MRERKKRCENCVHWLRTEPGELLGEGRCANRNMVRISGLFARLHTAAGFGCVAWGRPMGAATEGAAAEGAAADQEPTT